MEYGSLVTPMALAHPLYPIRTGRGISAETGGWMMCFWFDNLM